MRKDLINYAIAKSCGYGWLDEFPANVPDYCSDLNLMHKAELFHQMQFSHEYSWQLGDIVVRDNGLNPDKISCENAACIAQHATAIQRAEALLKTINKWEDAE